MATALMSSVTPVNSGRTELRISRQVGKGRPHGRLQLIAGVGHDAHHFDRLIADGDRVTDRNPWSASDLSMAASPSAPGAGRAPDAMLVGTPGTRRLDPEDRQVLFPGRRVTGTQQNSDTGGAPTPGTWRPPRPRTP